MQPTYPPEADEYRSRITDFLDANLPADWTGIGALSDDERAEFQVGWRKTLRANNLLAPNWPAEYGGGGLTHIEQVILNEEFAKRGVPTAGGNDAFSIGMVGNTILVWGTDEQKSYYIPRILDGDDVWCQGYSEPDAGSDLANVGCRAELDGDEWVINGQKIWTSHGQTANMIFVLARTAPDVAKHAGISFLLVGMDQPGVELRPITNMVGHDHFNEVFFTDARCPKGNVLGELNNGWAVGNTLLGFERGVGATTTSLGFGAEFDQFVELARERGLTDDPHVRQDIATFYTNVEIMRLPGDAGTHPLPPRRPTGPRVVDRQAVLERAPPGDHRGGDERARRRGNGRLRRGDPRRPRRTGDRHREHARQLDRVVHDRPPRHDLRRHQRGAAQHRRRTCARPAEGTTRRHRRLERLAIALDTARGWHVRRRRERQFVSGRRTVVGA